MTNRIDQRQRRKLSGVGLVGIGEEGFHPFGSRSLPLGDISFRTNDEAGKCDLATRQTFDLLAEVSL